MDERSEVEVYSMGSAKDHHQDKNVTPKLNQRPGKPNPTNLSYGRY